MQGKIVRNYVSGKARAAIALATWSLFIPLSSSWAQPSGPTDAKRGHELAARLCTNCHAIDGETSLERSEGEKRRVGFHIHYYLLADLLEAAATAVAGVKNAEPHQVARLKEAAAAWRKLS